jgi:GT2 family glycosyltransferase
MSTGARPVVDGSRLKALLLEAQGALYRGDREAAVDALEAAARAAPGEPAVHLQAARLCRQAGRPGRAARHAVETLRIRRGDPRAATLLAAAAREAGRPDLARRVLRAVLRGAPGYAPSAQALQALEFGDDPSPSPHASGGGGAGSEDEPLPVDRIEGWLRQGLGHAPPRGGRTEATARWGLSPLLHAAARAGGGSGEWIASGRRARFALEGRCPRGWIAVRFAGLVQNVRRVELLLDYGDEFEERVAVDVTPPGESLVFVDDFVATVELDVTPAVAGAFDLGGLEARRSGALERRVATGGARSDSDTMAARAGRLLREWLGLAWKVLDLWPSANVVPRAGEGGRWTAQGPAPRFALVGALPAGWSKIRLGRTGHGAGHVALVPDFGDGPCEAGAVRLRRESAAYVRLGPGLRGATVVVRSGAGEFDLEGLEVRCATGAEVLAASLWRLVRRETRALGVPGGLRRCLSLFLGRSVEARWEAVRALASARRGEPSDDEIHARFVASRDRAAAGRSASAPRVGVQAALRFCLIVPVADGEEKTAEATVRTVIGQTHEELEVWLLAAGSRVGRLRRLAERAPRVHVVESATGRAPFSIPEKAVGEFVSFLDPGDEIEPDALEALARSIAASRSVDMAYSDEDRIDGRGKRYAPFFKPAWSPEYFESYPYIGRMTCFRMELARECASTATSESDLARRVASRARAVAHVPEVLCHRRAPGAPPGRADLRLDEVRENGMVRLVSVVIAGAGRSAAAHGAHDDLIARCVESVVACSYPRHEIIVVEGDDLPQATRARIAPHVRSFEHQRGPTSLAAKLNLGALSARGELLLFLAHDVEAGDPGWMEEMAGLAGREGVGAVDARILSQDGTVLYGGTAFDPSGLPWAAFQGCPADHPGYFSNNRGRRNTLAAGGACLMTRTETFRRAGGFDERFPTGLFAEDYTLRLAEAGYRIVHTAKAALTRIDGDPTEDRPAPADLRLFRDRWLGTVLADPFFPDRLDRTTRDFRLEECP